SCLPALESEPPELLACRHKTRGQVLTPSLTSARSPTVTRSSNSFCLRGSQRPYLLAENSSRAPKRSLRLMVPHPSASSSLLSTALTRLRPGTLRRPRKRSTPCARNSQGRARSSSRPRASHHDGPRLNAASQVKRPLHSITSSAAASSVGGTASPNVFAVTRLMTSSNVAARRTGISFGCSPLSTRPV